LGEIVIKVLVDRSGSFSFDAEKFRIDDVGRLVLLQGEDTVVAVFAHWEGCWQLSATTSGKAR
jgi:hypothetical protein